MGKLYDRIADLFTGNNGQPQLGSGIAQGGANIIMLRQRWEHEALQKAMQGQDYPQFDEWMRMQQQPAASQ